MWSSGGRSMKRGNGSVGASEEGTVSSCRGILIGCEGFVPWGIDEPRHGVLRRELGMVES